jgi:drug/metabolite transporter (DMT)-like permease
VLFGVSPPLIRRLLPHSGVPRTSALLYGGAAVALVLFSIARRGAPRHEARLSRRDAPTIAAVAVLGGIAGPLLLLFGLERTSGLAGSLLLNLEAVATMLLAVFFGEHLGRRLLGAAALILVGATLVSGPTSSGGTVLVGAVAIAGACVCWGVDNNLTQRLSLRDPTQIATAKAVAAVVGLGAIALAAPGHWPSPARIGLTMLLGAGAYGASIVLDVYALRLLGAAREAAVFAAAPFAGAVLAIALGDRLGVGVVAGALLITVGVIVMVSERHGHRHLHQPLAHEHAHLHDEHHLDHEHVSTITGSHSHEHRHTPIAHVHPHLPDAHHRHQH